MISDQAAFECQVLDHPLLTRKEEYALLRAVAKGLRKDKKGKGRFTKAGKKAFDKLVLHNMRMVCKQAHRIRKRYRVPFSDLLQVGTIGLMIAVTHFRVSEGVRFSTYAMYWIRQSMQRHCYGAIYPIRVPDRVLWGREPLKFKIGSLQALDAEPITPETPTGEDMVDRVDGDDRLLLLPSLLRRINPPSFRIALVFRAMGFGLEEIGEILRISRERVRQIADSALRQVQRSLTRTPLEVP